MEDLIEKATDAKALLHAIEIYREPPAPEKSLLPEYASKLSKGKTKLSVDEIDHITTQVSAIIQENIVSMRENRTNKDARRCRNSSDSEGSIETYSSSKKKYKKRVYENKAKPSGPIRTNYSVKVTAIRVREIKKVARTLADKIVASLVEVVNSNSIPREAGRVLTVHLRTA